MENKLKQFLQNQKTYIKTKEYRLKVMDGDQDTIYMIQSVICQILREKSSDPLQKLMAIKLAKDCMETFNEKFIDQAQRNVLTQLEKIAIFRLEDSDKNRGKQMYSLTPDTSLAQVGNSTLQLALECIWVWSKWFPIDPETQHLSYYKITYMKLHRIGVTFAKLEYFRSKDVMKNLPEMTVPIKMLRQATQLIDQDLLKNNGQPSPTKQIVDRLTVSLKSLVNSFKRDIFYSDIMHRCVRKIKKQKIEDADQGSLDKKRSNAKLNIDSQFSSSGQQQNRSSFMSGQTNSELYQLMKENQQLRTLVDKQAKQILELQKQLLVGPRNQTQNSLVKQEVKAAPSYTYLNSTNRISSKSYMIPQTSPEQVLRKSDNNPYLISVQKQTRGIPEEIPIQNNLLINLSPDLSSYTESRNATDTKKRGTSLNTREVTGMMANSNYMAFKQQSTYVSPLRVNYSQNRSFNPSRRMTNADFY